MAVDSADEIQRDMSMDMLLDPSIEDTGGSD